jgi:LL-diaminopimelate aminotransferase
VYAVGELAALKRRLIADGTDVIDLSAGESDAPPPEIAVTELRRALADPAMSRYAFQAGLCEFREAVAAYMLRRFNVVVDPVTEVLPLLGSKEGLAHLPFAVLNPGEGCLVPDPGYPPYVGGAILAAAELVLAPLRSEAGFLVELDELPRGRLARLGLAYLNYPNNPTTAVAPREYLERTVAACQRHGIVLAYDNPYCEITFDGYRAPSVLEIEGAREVALEFHSLSKSFAMTGWRLGWAVGGAELIEALSRVKGFVDTGPFLAVQRAGAVVLENAETTAGPIRRAIAERRVVAVELLGRAGLSVAKPKATMYLWVPVPQGFSSAGFADALLKEAAVMVVPGSAFGAGGEGYVRFALTVDRERLAEMAKRVAAVMERLGASRAPA